MRQIIAIALGVLGVGLIAGCGGGVSIAEGPMPDGGSFTGVWHSPQYGEMHMVQTGTNVVGEFTKDERSGRIQGTARGNTMRFEWSEERELVSGVPNSTRGRGYFRYEIGEDGDHYIRGMWGHDSAESGGGEWNAVRDRRATPHLSGHANTAGGEENFEEFDSAGGGGGGEDSATDEEEGDDLDL